MTHDKEKNQLVRYFPEMIQIMELVHKDNKRE